ncbi:MAG: CotH kinase family protein, partial [Eubacteriales bacterium]|nr:CotH kinase family protein [Eubacteriales bacterium]
QAWSIEVGEDTEENIIAKFNRLVSFIKDTDDKTTFKNNANAYFNVDAALNYYLFCYVACAVDNLGKNMLMVTYDGSHWIPSLYDLDGLWGVGYDGKTKYPATAPCPGAYQCTTSLLWQKLESFYAAELKERYALLRQSALSQDNILKAFREFIGSIPPQLYEYNTRRWLGMREMRRTLEQMEEWIPLRLAYVDTAIQQIGGGAVIDPEIWDGSKLTDTFSSSGGAAEYINTEFIPFSDDNTAWTILARVSKSAVNDTIYFSSFCEASTPGNMGMIARVVPASWLGQIGDAPTLHIQVIQPSTGTISHTWAVADLTGDYLDIAITRAEDAYKIYFNNALVEQGNAPTLSAVTETLLIGAQWDSTREAVMRTGTMTIPYFEVVNSTLDAAAIAAKFATAPTAE